MLTHELKTNSGVGHSICERLIDTFLTTHSLTSHLVLLPTTRSPRKAAETVSLLRAHLARAASSKSLAARGTTRTQDAIDRVHIANVQLDLCDLSTVRRAADQLVAGTVAFDAGPAAGEHKIPRLDAVIFNAGIGGWTHVSFPAFFWDILTTGWVEATTRPRSSKKSKPGLTVQPLPGCRDVLGLVFCANVFGHYLLAHYLLPLLSRPEVGDAPELPPGRIIWQGSVACAARYFSIDDLQSLNTTVAYESSKYLTDLLCLTADLPSAKPHTAPYFETVPASPSGRATRTKPNVYLAHPGIVATTMFPLHFALMWGYILGTTFSRWIGSPWHPVMPYKAAVAMVWLALAPQAELDSQNATKSKWGSCTDFWGNTMVKKTEVDGWGWEGRAETQQDIDKEDASLIRVMQKSVGRRVGAELPTEESMAEFEETGAKCWAEMERLRVEWEAKIDKAK